MCYLSFKYLRYSSSPDYIYVANFGPLKDWQPNNLSIKKRGGEIVPGLHQLSQASWCKGVCEEQPGSNSSAKAFLPCRTPKARQHGRKKSKTKISKKP